MEMTGERTVPVDREQAWKALNDPEVLGQCIPGCESMEQTGDNEFKAKVRTSVGPVNAQFKGRVTLSDVVPPESYKMTFKGDGTAGFAQGTADIKLQPADGGGTIVQYAAQAKIGGKLAQIGSRLVDGAARKMADDFFTNLTTHMGGDPEPEPDPEPESNPDTRPVEASAAAGPAGAGGGGLMAMIRRCLAKLFGRGT